MDNLINLSQEQLQELAGMIAKETAKNDYLRDELKKIDAIISKKKDGVKRCIRARRVWLLSMSSLRRDMGEYAHNGLSADDVLVQRVFEELLPTWEMQKRIEAELATLRDRRKRILGKLFPAPPAE